MREVEEAIATLLLGDPSADTAAAMAVCREQEPVLWVPPLEGWYVTRFDDVRDLFSDPRTTADPRAHLAYEAPVTERGRHWVGAFPFLSEDPGTEARGRVMATRGLSRQGTTRLESLVTEVVDEYADAIRDASGVVDLVAQFAAPVPATVVSRWTGVPQGSDEAQFRELAHKAVRGASPVLTPKKRRKTEMAQVALSEAILELARKRVADPRDDLLSDLIAASGGEDELDEIVRVVVGLVCTGAETTVRATTNSVRILLARPDLRKRLVDEPGIMMRALHEMMRYEAPLTHMARFAARDFELRGKRVRKGQLLLLSIQAAQRDPSVFTDPDTIDFDREPENLLAFGRGAHYCVGANLAWLQLDCMMRALLGLLPENARLLEDQIWWGGRGVLGRVKTLPVDFS